jgi:hypothetical protein
LIRLVAFWDRIRGIGAAEARRSSSPSRHSSSPSSPAATPEESPVADAERFAFDQQMRILRKVRPRPLASDVVLIGTNEDTYRPSRSRSRCGIGISRR